MIKKQPVINYIYLFLFAMMLAMAGGIGLSRSHPSPRPIVALTATSILKNYGVGHGDMVTSINGRSVSLPEDLSFAFSSSDYARPLTMDFIRRGPGAERYSISIPSIQGGFNERTLGLDNPEYFIGLIKRESIAERLGLKVLDRLVLIQGQAVASLDVNTLMQALRREGRLHLSVIRGEQVKSLSLEFSENLDITGMGLEAYLRVLGVTPLSNLDPR